MDSWAPFLFLVLCVVGPLAFTTVVLCCLAWSDRSKAIRDREDWVRSQSRRGVPPPLPTDVRRPGYLNEFKPVVKPPAGPLKTEVED